MSEATVVVDASALLAMLNDEPGGDVVATAIGAAVIGSVNWSEVVQKVQGRGLPTAELAAEMEALGLEIVPFDVETAEAAARLWHAGGRNLSLADRACLALGQASGTPVLTADRVWSTLDLEIKIKPIR